MLKQLRWLLHFGCNHVVEQGIIEGVVEVVARESFLKRIIHRERHLKVVAHAAFLLHHTVKGGKLLRAVAQRLLKQAALSFKKAGFRGSGAGVDHKDAITHDRFLLFKMIIVPS